MRPTRILRWIGIIFVSLWVGILVGLFSKELLLLTLPGTTDTIESSVNKLTVTWFIWFSASYFIGLGYRGKIGFHVFFVNGLLLLVFCFYVFWNTLRILHSFDYPSDQSKFALSVFVQLVVTFLILAGELSILTALLVDKNEEKRRRFRRVKKN